MLALDSLTAVMLLGIFVSVTAALLAWHERPEPGAIPLAALLVGASWWSIFFVFELQAATLNGKILWSNVQWVGVVIIPLAWLLFSLEYTGKDRYIQARYVAVLSIVPIVTVILAVTDGYHDLLYTNSRLVDSGGFSILSRTGGPWYWITAGYTYILGVLGMIPLLGLIRSDTLPFRGQSLALLVGATVPWITNFLYLAGAVPIPGVDPTPIGFAASGVALLGAIKRYRLLEISPAPNWKARHLVFDRMEEGAVVVDGHDYVVDMNDSMAELLGTTAGDALGRPAAEVVPEYERLPDDGKPSRHVGIPQENTERAYDVTVTPIDDSHGRTIGRVITFHDIQGLLRQQQRLEVLNRVLRHNLRNEITIISGYADLLAEDDDGVAELITEHALGIEEMGEKARTISRIFEREDDPAVPVPVDDLLDQVADRMAEEYPEVTLEVDRPQVDLFVDGVLAPVLENVVENAAEHNTNSDPCAEVAVEEDGDLVRVTVADNGPGIDEFELSVIETGKESPLEHASGLGLWLITWGTTIAGGEVEFEENYPTGTVVTVEVPALSPPKWAGIEEDKLAP